jgi:predicted DNA-binding protein YlxM (UPF0122 family)
MIPDKVKAVLRDYRSGKASSASELAKLHGVSRSAVYRLLKKEGDTPELKVTEKEQTAEKPEENGTLMEDLFSKAEQFANTLGLPEQAGKVLNEEPKDAKAEQEKEEQLDALMDAMMGTPPQGLTLPAGLQEALDEPMPTRPRTILRRMEPELELKPQVTEARRAEIVQKIVFNIQHFGPQLEVITGANREAFLQTLPALSTPQLSETLTTLERTRSVGNIANGFKHLFYVAGQATETATQFAGMSTQGFTAQLKAQDEEITMIMKELAIEQWERLKVIDSPQVRLGMLFCMTLVQVDTRNKLEEHFKRSQVPEHIAKNSVDL